MSLGKKNRSTLVLVLVAVVVIACLTQAKPFSMVVLPAPGYRAYEWKWTFDITFSTLIPGYEEVHRALAQVATSEVKKQMEKQLDDNGQPIKIYSGPTYSEILFQNSPLNFIIVFRATVTTYFYGYFPNNIPEAVKLPARTIGNAFDRIMDFFFPKVYAIEPITAVLIGLIIAAIIVYIICQSLVTHESIVTEKDKYDKYSDYMNNPNNTAIDKLIFTFSFMFSDFISLLMSFGPTWGVLIVGIVLIMLYGAVSGGKRRR